MTRLNIIMAKIKCLFIGHDWVIIEYNHKTKKDVFECRGCQNIIEH